MSEGSHGRVRLQAQATSRPPHIPSRRPPPPPPPAVSRVGFGVPPPAAFPFRGESAVPQAARVPPRRHHHFAATVTGHLDLRGRGGSTVPGRTARSPDGESGDRDPEAHLASERVESAGVQQPPHASAWQGIQRPGCWGSCVGLTPKAATSATLAEEPVLSRKNDGFNKKRPLGPPKPAPHPLSSTSAGRTRPPAPVAQLDRASVYETEGHRFESCQAR